MKMKFKRLLIGITIIVLLGIITASVIFYFDYRECATTQECLEKCRCEVLSECTMIVSIDEMGEAINSLIINGSCNG